MASRMNLKTGKKAVEQPPPEEPPLPVVGNGYKDLEDEFGDLRAFGLEEKVETEKLSKYLVDDTDLEGKSFVDRGEKMIFTLVSIMAEYPPFEKFRLGRFPKKWLHYALGEEGRGRTGVLEVLKGNVRIGDPKDMGLPGQQIGGRRM